MGWHFPWLSSSGSTFDSDFGVSFTSDPLETLETRYNYKDAASIGPEVPGLSAFVENPDEEIFHTYPTLSRGLDVLNPVYQLLQPVPAGRDEDELPSPMSWLRRHYEY